MIEIISAMLFAISANIDNIIIGISYGIKKIHIPLKKNIIIAVATSIVTFLSMYMGELITLFLTENLANTIGSSLLIFIGGYSMIKDLFLKKDEEDRGSKNLNIKELCTIIFMLSSNNIATGIAASISGINIIYTVIFTFIFCNLFMYLGNKIGKKIRSKRIQKYSILISSLLLILIGLLEFIKL